MQKVWALAILIIILISPPAFAGALFNEWNIPRGNNGYSADEVKLRKVCFEGYVYIVATTIQGVSIIQQMKYYEGETYPAKCSDK